MVDSVEKNYNRILFSFNLDQKSEKEMSNERSLNIGLREERDVTYIYIIISQFYV